MSEGLGGAGWGGGCEKNHNKLYATWEAQGTMTAYLKEKGILTISGM
jgi:hypothetical protein